jgi:hypothetical protein
MLLRTENKATLYRNKLRTGLGSAEDQGASDATQSELSGPDGAGTLLAAVYSACREAAICPSDWQPRW